MQKLVDVNIEKCVGCNRCISVCPIETANIVYAAPDGQMKVKIDDDKCIACGACVHTCRHGSRTYIDDTERFISDLMNGVSISMFAAPAARTNNPRIGQVYAWLKQLGVRKLFDVSLGADICTWAHIRYIQEKHPGPLISQPCPAIVEYALRHNTKLVKNLSPIHSPMLCTAIYMRKYMGVRDRIAALSPCIAKTREFEETDSLVEYNVTFDALWTYIEDHRIRLPNSSVSFDHEPGAWGRIYPMPGGLKENVTFYLGNALRIDQSEGQSKVYRDLDTYAEQPSSQLPALFDVLNCPEGCNLGTGCRHERNIFEINTMMEKQRLESPGGRNREYMERLFAHFDSNLRLEDFIRTYNPMIVSKRVISDAEIKRAMDSMLKTEPWEMNFDCGACGSDTCVKMARQIVLGTNLPENCALYRKLALAKKSEEVAHGHESLVKDVDVLAEIETMVTKGISDLHESFSQVGSSVSAYDKLVKVIKNVSSHITLVAINAKTEAARLGQNGRGFAVVAQEIQSMAQQSQSAVEEAERSSKETATAFATLDNAVSSLDRVVKLVDDVTKDIERNVTILEDI